MPFPGPAPVTVIQFTGELPDHAQPDWVATASVPPPPAAEMVTDPGVTVYEHAAAAWFTVKVFPAIVTVAERAIVTVFAATLKPVDPEPVPLAPLVTVTHPAPLTDVQAQPDVVVTATEPVPPDAAID